MKELFGQFVESLAHPFEYHREAVAGKATPTLWESLAMSWVFVVMSSIMRVALMSMTAALIFDVVMGNLDFLNELLPNHSYSGHYFFIISSVLDVIFFPLYTLISLEVWQFFIRAFAWLKGMEGDYKKTAEEIVKGTLSSHLLQIIPIFGDAAQKISSAINLYAGVRVQLGFSVVESLILLIFPSLILFGFLITVLLLTLMLFM